MNGQPSSSFLGPWANDLLNAEVRAMTHPGSPRLDEGWNCSIQENTKLICKSMLEPTAELKSDDQWIEKKIRFRDFARETLRCKSEDIVEKGTQYEREVFFDGTVQGTAVEMFQKKRLVVIKSGLFPTPSLTDRINEMGFDTIDYDKLESGKIRIKHNRVMHLTPFLSVILFLFAIMFSVSEASQRMDVSTVAKPGYTKFFFCGYEPPCNSCLSPQDCKSCDCTPRWMQIQNFTNYVQGFKHKSKERSFEVEFSEEQSSQNVKVLHRKSVVNCEGEIFEAEEIPLSCQGKSVFFNNTYIERFDMCDKMDTISWVTYRCYYPWFLLKTLIGTLVFYLIAVGLFYLTGALSRLLASILIIVRFTQFLIMLAFLILYILFGPYYRLPQIRKGPRKVVTMYVDDVINLWCYTLSFLEKHSQSSNNQEHTSQRNDTEQLTKSYTKEDFQQKRIFFAILILAMLPSALSKLEVKNPCSELLSSVDTHFVCEKIDEGNDLELCYTSLSIQVDLFVGSTQCIRIFDKVSEKTTTLELSLRALGWKMVETNCYWTSETTSIKSESFFSCWSLNGCTENPCGTPEYFTPNPFGLFTTEVVDLPGKTNCYRSCKCIDCESCGYCVNSCVYSRFAFETGSDVKVCSLEKSEVFFVVEVSTVNSDGSSPVYYLNSLNQATEDITFWKVGGNNPPDPIIPYTQTCDNEKLCSAQKANEGICGKLGMIQSSNKISETPISQINGFYSCVRENLQINKVLVSYEYLETSYIQLPWSNGYNTIEMDKTSSNKFVSSYSGSVSLSLNFGKKSLNFTNLVERACPKISGSPIVDGFWGSSEGFRIILSVYSTCGKGSVSVRSEPMMVLSPTMINIDNTPATFNISSFSSLSSVKFILYVGDTSVTIEGKLRDPKSVLAQNSSSVLSENFSLGSGLNFAASVGILSTSVLIFIVLLGVITLWICKR